MNQDLPAKFLKIHWNGSKILPAGLAKRVAKIDPGEIILIDGQSGSGKSTLAKCLQQYTLGQILTLEDLYPGWTGLSSGSLLLGELLSRRAKAYPVWDWYKQSYRKTQEIDWDKVLIVEGSGSISRITLGLASLTLWLKCKEDTRRRRVLRREGGEENLRFTPRAGLEPYLNPGTTAPGTSSTNAPTLTLGEVTVSKLPLKVAASVHPVLPSACISSTDGVNPWWWNLWQEQEQQHYARTHPQACSDYWISTDTEIN